MEFLTCTDYEKVTQFARIKRNLHLKTSLALSHFNKYITQCISRPSDYQVLIGIFKIKVGWVSYSRNHANLSKYCIKRKCVASIQYSDSCKVFVFPINSLDSRWLTKIPIYSSTPKIELLFMLVYKLQAGQNSHPIIPEPKPLPSMDIFRLIPGRGEIATKTTTLDRIRVRYLN